MYDALRALRDRLKGLFGDGVDVRVVTEAKEVPIRKTLVVLRPLRERAEVVGVGGKYVSREVSVDVLIYALREIRRDAQETVLECFEKVKYVYEKLMEDLLRNPVVGEYVITYVSGLEDATRRMYGVCLGTAEVRLKRYDVVS